ncbi:MAG TPA: PilZ domain-containing protein [Limnochordales bacterium]
MADGRNPLEIGVRLRLRRTDQPEAGSYTTRVEDMDDQRIAVSMPTVQGMPVALPRGVPVELELVRAQPPGEGSYRATSVVLGRSMGRVPLLYLRSPQQWERHQLRQFFRVPAVLTVQIRAAGEADAPWMLGRTRDISGGGFRAVVGRPLPADQAVEVVLVLPERRITAKGVVRRVEEVEDNPGRQWTVGIAFTDIAERERDAIIRFVFKRQIELRKKGMA